MVEDLLDEIENDPEFGSVGQCSDSTDKIILERMNTRLSMLELKLETMGLVLRALKVVDNDKLVLLAINHIIEARDKLASGKSVPNDDFFNKSYEEFLVKAKNSGVIP